MKIKDKHGAKTWGECPYVIKKRKRINSFPETGINNEKD